jgi:hypothetical protein
MAFQLLNYKRAAVVEVFSPSLTAGTAWREGDKSETIIIDVPAGNEANGWPSRDEADAVRRTIITNINYFKISRKRR